MLGTREYTLCSPFRAHDSSYSVILEHTTAYRHCALYIYEMVDPRSQIYHKAKQEVRFRSLKSTKPSR